MRLSKIELNNFGSYRFQNSFNIDIDDKTQRIVIIGGRNGAGKTTLFTAIELCLYGHYTFGYKNSGKIYTKKVFSLINDVARMNDDETASVALSFSDSSNGDLDQYTVKRSWSWKKGEVKESFEAHKNGAELFDRELDDFQNFLITLIPPALLKLYFFDGEKIADYLLDDQKNNVRDALMVLSGNDTFDIMYAGVKKVLNATVTEEDSITREYLACKAAVKELEDQKQRLVEEIQCIQLESEEVSGDIEKKKKEYASQGGLTLDEWKQLNSDLKNEEEKRERINAERKSVANDIIPFIISMPLLERVHPQIIKEHEYQTWKTISSIVKTDDFRGVISNSLRRTLSADDEEAAHQVYEEIVKYLLPQTTWESFDPLFGLSEDDETSVQAVLNRISQFDITQIAGYKVALDESIEKCRVIREKLQSSSIDNYQSFVDELAQLNEKAHQNALTLQSKTMDLSLCDANLDRANKDLSAAYKKLEQSLKRKSVSTISGNVVLLIEDLQNEVYSKLKSDVRNDTLAEFKRLFRKKRFIDDIAIDDSFVVHLLRYQYFEKSDLIKIGRRSGVNGIKRSLQKYGFDNLCDMLHVSEASDDFMNRLESYQDTELKLLVEINKDTLSKGEKQIFVMSLYWAMMKQSKSDLPFIIDTPFARIDSEHRSNIVENFFKELNGQLFVLSTDEELVGKHISALVDNVSNKFMLEYDEESKCTSVIADSYFEV